MDESTFDEIISCLAKCGRPDLIMELKDFEKRIVDTSYEPPRVQIRREVLSDTEGSACSEDELDYIVDEEGFYSLK